MSLADVMQPSYCEDPTVNLGPLPVSHASHCYYSISLTFCLLWNAIYLFNIYVIHTFINHEGSTKVKRYKIQYERGKDRWTASITLIIVLLLLLLYTFCGAP